MLQHAHFQLTQLMDLCYFLKMSPEEAAQFFQAQKQAMAGNELALGQRPITENPFTTQRLIFSIKQDLAS